ncbi:Rieske 2Fe-2S domain-containing protein [Micromonospora sp. R77]|uniref:Rieske 2Fe-2S domain-containing protein n=1 Tax=Micromonospora sp. R77 TaxID=2925836 RepID=UPI001F619A85|nr:Rieske 2Fe-2S domain-containing protein [Micromonospora sp. R77]MCI4066219.1 Rieske 2Fe-2S domain-containing protein [Micromonospora sp. R77]
MTRPGRGPVRAADQPGATDAVPLSSVAPQPMTRLAASWYVALPSRMVGAKPRPLTLFGRQLVAWRDGAGTASVLPRHCPHLGASLALGKVVEGQLRCVFHHWRFDATGACVHIPRLDNLPSHMARQRAYPVRERYGFLWVWYGSPEPMFALPQLPAEVMNRSDYQRHRFAHLTSASPRRVLEQAYDHHHFAAAHGLAAIDPAGSTVLPDPEAAVRNGPPIPAQAWTGARLEFHGPRLPRPLRNTDGPTELLVDGWPGGQRLTFSVAGQDTVRELLAVTPVRDGHSIVRGWSFVRRSGSPAHDASMLLGYRRFRRRDLREGLRGFAEFRQERHSRPTEHDAPLAHFRERYDDWVRHANRDGEGDTAP